MTFPVNLLVAEILRVPQAFEKLFCLNRGSAAYDNVFWVPLEGLSRVSLDKYRVNVSSFFDHLFNECVFLLIYCTIL